MYDTVTVQHILRKVGGKLFVAHQVFTGHVQDMCGTARKDTHEGRLTTTALSAVAGRDDILDKIGNAVRLRGMETPQDASQAKDEIGKAVVKFHLLIFRERLTLVQQLLLMLPILIGKATQDAQRRPHLRLFLSSPVDNPTVRLSPYL